MRPIRVTLTPQIDAAGICASQSPGGAGNLTIAGALASGGSVSLNHGHLITITSAGNDSGRTFTVTGTDFRGFTITEAITGASGGTAVGTSYFKTVTQVAINGASAGAVTVGVNGASASNWYILDEGSKPFHVGIGLELTGTATATVQHTFDNLQTTSDLNTAITTFNHDELASQTSSADGNYIVPVYASRVIVPAYTSGNIVFSLLQAG